MFLTLQATKANHTVLNVDNWAFCSASKVYPFVFKWCLTSSAWCRLKLLPLKFVKLMRFSRPTFTQWQWQLSSIECGVAVAPKLLKVLPLCSLQGFQWRRIRSSSSSTPDKLMSCMHKYIYSYKRKNVPWPWEVGQPQNALNCVPKIYCGDLFTAHRSSVCVCVCVWELARLEAYLFIHFLIYWCLSDPKRFWLDPLGHQLFGWLAVELVGKMEKGGT